MDTVSQIARFIRWRDWGPGKLTVLWSLCFYIAVAYEIPFGRFALTFLVFMIFAGTQSALGYVLNDWGDRALDRRQFKYNGFNGMSNLECILTLTLVLVTALVSGLPLALRPGFTLLWITWVAITAAYSLEPLRLKTRGLAGLLVSFVAQWFLPVLLTFAAFEVAGGSDMWIIAIALTISGAALEVGHQRWDRERDAITRAETFAVTLSNEKVSRFYALMLLLDKIAIGMIIAVIVSTLLTLGQPWLFELAIGIILLYAGLVIATLKNAVRAMQGGELDDPYYGPRAVAPTPAQFLHQTLLNFFVPVILGVALTLQAPLYAIMLGLFLVWRVVLGGADWLWPLRAIRIRLSK